MPTLQLTTNVKVGVFKAKIELCHPPFNSLILMLIALSKIPDLKAFTLEFSKVHNLICCQSIHELKAK